MRILLPILALLLLAGSASAQIYAMEFKDQKYAKGYKKHLFEWNGRHVVLVEVRGGLGRNDTGGFTWKPNDRIEFYVQNPADPLDLAYKIDKEGFLKVKKKSLTIGISGDRFAGLTPFMLNESFHTLAISYQRRLDSMAALETTRDESEKGSAVWFAAHDQLVSELELLQAWLAQTGFPKAANKLDRDLLRQKKLISEAKTARITKAMESIRTVDTDPKLTEVAHRLGGPDLDFHTQESQHIRIIYHNGISDAVATRLLELGEAAIDGFRTQFVDPHLSEDFKDYIPDDMFLEFFFSTDQQQHYEKFFEDYWGQSWGSGDKRRRRLDIGGTLFMNGKLYSSYSRTDKDDDLEGRVVHIVGHRLANFHYQMPQGDQEWLEEGVGFYLSFNFLNRNSLNCVAFKPPPRPTDGTVARGGKTKAKKDETKTQTVMRGLRDVMAGVALNAGVPMAQLVPKRRYDFGNEDTAKAWAFFAFLADSTGKEGQVWLRSLSGIMFAEDFQLKIRSLTEKLFGFEGGDPMEKFEEQWRQYLRDHYEV